MADLLIELYSEEIPAGMQADAAEQLKRKLVEFLDSFGVSADTLDSHVAPQRVALIATGLPQNLPDRREQKKGPRVDAPEQAIKGFLRANGLDRTEGLSVNSLVAAYWETVVLADGKPLTAMHRILSVSVRCWRSVPPSWDW